MLTSLDGYPNPNSILIPEPEPHVVQCPVPHSRKPFIPVHPHAPLPESLPDFHGPHPKIPNSLQPKSNSKAALEIPTHDSSQRIGANCGSCSTNLLLTRITKFR